MLFIGSIYRDRTPRSVMAINLFLNGFVTPAQYPDSSEMLMFTCQELASKSSNHATSRTFAFPSNFLSLALCFSGTDSEYGCPDFSMW